MAKTDDIWLFVEEKLKTSVPTYIKNILHVCGFNNGITISAIEEEDIEYFETQVKNGKVSSYFKEGNALEGCLIDQKKFEFSRGHKKFLKFIAEFLRNHSKLNGPNAFTLESKKTVKGTKNTQQKQKKQLSYPQRKKFSVVNSFVESAIANQNTCNGKPLNVAISDEVIKQHSRIILNKIVTSLQTLTSKMFRENVEIIKSQIPNELLIVKKAEKREKVIDDPVDDLNGSDSEENSMLSDNDEKDDKLSPVRKYIATVFCPYCQKTIKVFHVPEVDNTFLWSTYNFNRHLILKHDGKKDVDNKLPKIRDVDKTLQNFVDVHVVPSKNVLHLTPDMTPVAETDKKKPKKTSERPSKKAPTDVLVDNTTTQSVDGTSNKNLDSTPCTAIDETNKKKSIKTSKKSEEKATKKTSIDVNTPTKSVDGTNNNLDSTPDRAPDTAIDETHKKKSKKTSKKSEEKAPKKTSNDVNTPTQSVDGTPNNNLDSTPCTAIDKTHKKKSKKTSKKSEEKAPEKTSIDVNTPTQSVDGTFNNNLDSTPDWAPDTAILETLKKKPKKTSKKPEETSNEMPKISLVTYSDTSEDEDSDNDEDVIKMDTIDPVGMDSQNLCDRQRVPTLRNGYKSRYGRYTIITTNTCGFDSIVSIFICLYFDNLNFRAFISSSSSKFSKLVKLISTTVSLTEQSSALKQAYVDRNALLRKLYTNWCRENVNIANDTISINCDTGIGGLFAQICLEIEENIASAIEERKCNICGTTTGRILPFLTMKMNSVSDLTKIQDLIDTRCSHRSCTTCKSDCLMTKYYNNLLVLEVEPNSDIKNQKQFYLKDVSERIHLDEKDFKLIAIVQYHPRIKHFSVVVRRTNEWFCYDNLTDSEMAVNESIAMYPYLLFYASVNYNNDFSTSFSSFIFQNECRKSRMPLIRKSSEFGTINSKVARKRYSEDDKENIENNDTPCQKPPQQNMETSQSNLSNQCEVKRNVKKKLANSKVAQQRNIENEKKECRNNDTPLQKPPYKKRKICHSKLWVKADKIIDGVHLRAGNFVICSLPMNEPWPANSPIVKNFVGKVCRIKRNAQNNEIEEMELTFLKKSPYSKLIFYPENMELIQNSKFKILKILKDPHENRRGEFVFKDESILEYIF